MMGLLLRRSGFVTLTKLLTVRRKSLTFREFKTARASGTTPIV